ncbi:HVO_0234 family beta-propeller protein [Halovenus marina]|uniref:HVO_0234 family beta-propeller protein n=1 Tax=Halovenus marina TaxID=3396621 RepID=UPI003F54D938
MTAETENGRETDGDDDFEGDDATDERRLIGTQREETDAYLATDLGVVRVSITADRVGQFSLVHRCSPRSVAADEETLLVGTDEDVLIVEDDAVESMGFGPAVAVGLAEGTLLAAGSDGRVARFDDGWETVGTVTDPRRFEGSLLAAGDGVYRVGETLEPLGLTDVMDVTTAATGPVAATADGIYHHTDGEWNRTFRGAATAVASSGTRLAALDDEGILAYNDEWRRMNPPTDEVSATGTVALAYGESLYAVTEDGTVLVYTDPELVVDGRGGWRSHALGVAGVTEIAIR